MVESKRLEQLKPHPSHKSARSASELHATSTAYLIRSEYCPVLQLCSEALVLKRGVATDTPGSQNSSTEPVCA